MQPLAPCKLWRVMFVGLLLGKVVTTSGQEFEVPLADLMGQAQAWAEQNLDTNVLKQLPEIDPEKAQQFLRDFQRELQGQYVVDLAALRGVAELALPLLEQQPETQDVAVWLRVRMDYLKVADQLTLTISPPISEPGQPANRPNNPSAEREREVWVEEVQTRHWPPAASNYVTTLKPVFTAEKIPAELVWVAEAESSFDPRARSPVGAAGLFQLMPATAKRFGLSLWPRDQRLQPKPSATASAKYLKFLHDKFGDWRLALAAYNAGEGTVQRLLKKYAARSFDEIAPYLPAETQLYVPKVEAILWRREGVKLAELASTFK